MSSRKKKSAPLGTPPAQSTTLDPHLAIALAVLALCIITWITFSNSFQAGLVFDNKGLLLQDPRVREATRENVSLILGHSYWWPLGEAGLYRPLTTLSYLFNYAILGNRDQPEGYHWVNFILHLMNVLLVWTLARRLIGKSWPAFFTAAVWAVHPVLTESVTNVVGRADLLAAAGLLGGFLMYLKSVESTGWPRAAWLAGLTIATAVGVFSKESGVTIVGVVLLYELLWWKERQGKALLSGCAAMLLPIAAMLYQRWYVLSHSTPGEFPYTDNPIVGADFWTGRLTAIKVIARYLGLLIWPAKLSNDYSFPAIPLSDGSLQDWIAALVVLAAVAVVALLYRWNRTAFFLACFAIVNFAPVSNLLFPVGTIMAERFLYVPAIGLLACLVLGLFAIGEQFKLSAFAPVALCLIGAGFAVRTWNRNLDWRDDIALYTASAQAAPNSYKLHRLLASALFESDPSQTGIDRAVEEAEKSVALLDPLPDPLNKPDPYQLDGYYQMTKGDLARQRSPKEETGTSPESKRAYERALAVLLRCVAIDESPRPAFDRRSGPSVSGSAGSGSAKATTYQLLSGAYLRLDNPNKALETATKARSLDPLNPGIYRQRYYALATLRRGDEAASELAEGILVTSDPGLQDELVNFYGRVLPPQGCAIVQGPRGPAINPSCEIVRKHFCAAAAGTLRTRLQTGKRDLAQNDKNMLVRDFGCSSGALDKILAD